MLNYPTPFDGYAMDWVEELAAVKIKDEIIRLERKEISGILKNQQLISFYDQIEQLCSFPHVPDQRGLKDSPATFLYMIPKKQHEIKKLAPFIHSFCQSQDCQNVLDIGGGIGLLAQTLSHHFDLKVMSLDMDPVLQETGKKRYQKSRVTYHNIKVKADELSFQKLLGPNMVAVGLHTCGPLANDQIKSSATGRLKGIINFGCCYNKLSHFDSDQNISNFAQELPYKVHQNIYSLTLAARAHRKMSEKDYDLKLKVKFYRYAMHFLLHDEYKLTKIVTLGNTNPKLYDESFGTYALEQLRRINIESKHQKEELDAYFGLPARQELIWKMIAATFIRNALGRVLEVYILLDRVLYLREQGYQADLLEFFEEPISPRNLGIVASLSSLGEKHPAFLY